MVKIVNHFFFCYSLLLKYKQEICQLAKSRWGDISYLKMDFLINGNAIKKWSMLWLDCTKYHKISW